MMTSSISLLLIATALVLAILWYRTRDQRYLQGLGVVVGLFAIYLVYHRLRPEAVAEQMERKIREMAGRVEKRDVEGIFRHVAADFKMGGADRAGMQKYAQDLFDQGHLTSVTVSAFGESEVKDKTATIHFRVLIDGEYAGPARVVATFVLEADGQWRLQSFQPFHPTTQDRIFVPGLPQ